MDRDCNQFKRIYQFKKKLGVFLGHCLQLPQNFLIS